ncbi:MAG: hypothetical protein JJ992_16555, partial [Planctomycetes bacterium]|nr:hypothetical protein [Planctomycetota bacterium]
SSQMVTALGSACLRLGLIAAAFWFAMPQVMSIATRLPRRLTVAVVVGGLIVVITKGKALILVLLIVMAVAAVEFVGWLLKPLPKRRGRR